MAQNKRLLKKSLIGFEVETFTMNKKGYIINAADKLLKKAKSDKNFVIQKECGSSMIETGSYPAQTIPSTMGYLLTELEYLADIAEKEGILLCPLGTYPGKFDPFMRDDKRYKMQEYIFWKNRLKI